MKEVPRRVLIVDDDRVNSTALKTRLEKRGFEVFMLHDGESCLKLVVEKDIQLVLLDIMMPGITGIGVLKFIRQKYAETELPVIMVTAKHEPKDIVDALNLGANDYLTKPVDVNVAIARINTQLHIVELTQDRARKQELEAINAMITTYNHEINNPLTIAIGSCRRLAPGKKADEKVLETLNRSHNRIADILKKIKGVMDQEEIDYEEYTEETKMVKVK